MHWPTESDAMKSSRSLVEVSALELFKAVSLLFLASDMIFVSACGGVTGAIVAIASRTEDFPLLFPSASLGAVPLLFPNLDFHILGAVQAPGTGLDPWRQVLEWSRCPASPARRITYMAPGGVLYVRHL